ncbi:hypothetical protein NM688_g8254 [Phlebia brevispora]|uniref:Uncharacterized protein n=1 Tax=Phlebia brevispora TaxID=194682 RepID=A0ACC1RVA4_9APHY|nr:hypothetical protein NM688_g8254 [Phlebia brevispora]
MFAIASSSRGHGATNQLQQGLERTLAASLTTGAFVDTVYHLYSRRLANGNVGHPRAVYVNSTVLEATAEYFVAQLDGGFATKQTPDLERATYDYDEDSDIEDEEVPADGEDEDPNTNPDERSINQESHGCLRDMKFSIVVPDVAATTWQALMYYIYTGNITFAPLRSQGLQARKQAIVEYCTRNPDLPVPCSPKSMYRLADIVGLKDLKDLAYDDIRNKVSAQTVVEEVFSRFSSLYPVVRNMQLEYLYEGGMLALAVPTIEEKLKEAVEKRMPHAVEVMGAFVIKLSLLLVQNQDRNDKEDAAKMEVDASCAGSDGVRRKKLAFLYACLVLMCSAGCQWHLLITYRLATVMQKSAAPQPLTPAAGTVSSNASSYAHRLGRAVAASLTTGTFPDTAYHLYSRRLSNGNIGKPRIIYVNSTVLKAEGGYFVAQLDGGFDKKQIPEEETDTYDYDEDSDIEDADYDEPTGGALNVDDASQAKLDANAASSAESSESRKGEVLQSYNNLGVRYSIVIPGIASTTWQALIYYIYTGCVTFAPLRSQGVEVRKQAITEYHAQNPDLPTLCSPKSMYRLADIIVAEPFGTKVGLKELKSLAQADIRLKISESTVVEEIFSQFSSLYPGILYMQLETLYKDALVAKVIISVQQKVKQAADGHIPHAANVMEALVGKLSASLVEKEMEKQKKLKAIEEEVLAQEWTIARKRARRFS